LTPVLASVTWGYEKNNSKYHSYNATSHVFSYEEDPAPFRELSVEVLLYQNVQYLHLAAHLPYRGLVIGELAIEKSLNVSDTRQEQMMEMYYLGNRKDIFIKVVCDDVETGQCLSLRAQWWTKERYTPLMTCSFGIEKSAGLIRMTGQYTCDQDVIISIVNG
jgi:hypothetical protein